MGTYIEFNFEIRLKPDIPDKIRNIFDRLINDCAVGSEYTEEELKETHEFFQCRRWRQLFTHCADCPAPVFERTFYVNKLIIHGEVKAGDSEIDKFVDFISPHVKGRKKKQYLGWSKYDYDKDRQYWYVVRDKVL